MSHGSCPHIQISIQYLEIYNEQLYDLLDITAQPHELNIQDVRGTVVVTGLRNMVVRSEAEAMKLLFQVGQKLPLPPCHAAISRPSWDSGPLNTEAGHRPVQGGHCLPRRDNPFIQ